VTAATRWASEVVEDDMSKTHDSHTVADPDQRRVDAFHVRN
jgi:hypothetical protein